MIYILAGDIRSGKTTALEEWIGTWDKVKGILTPDDKDDDLRYLYNIETAERQSFQVEQASENTIRVGRFNFLEDTFKLANYILIKTFEEQDFEFLVFDELGKLELKNKGLHQAASYVIGNYETNESSHLLLVIRTFLVKDMIQHYNIRNFQIVSSESLP